MTITVLKPGPSTTVQDSGRPGLLRKGIPAAGAQDALALRVANALVGNPTGPPPLCAGEAGHAGLEFLLRGPKLRFDADAVVAVTGADLTPALDGEPVPPWEPIAVPAGSVLDTGAARRGARGYLAIAGGIEVPPFLGSRSTHLGVGVGGFDGRALAKGDHLTVGTASGRERRGAAPVSARYDFAAPPVLRVIDGPQLELFEPTSVEAFFAEAWELTPVANRMGFRFVGPRLEFRSRPGRPVRDAGSNPSNIVDEITPLGGIQVPDGAQLIVMGVEHPTAGGYAKIATVITADLGRLGQLRPGERTRFARVTVEEALEVSMEQDRIVDAVVAGVGA